MLANLNEININGNPFEDIPDVVDSLKTVGPNLKCLHINLFEEDQVDYLLRNLEHMQILNGLKVERETLFAESEDSSELETEEKTQEAANTNQRVGSKEEAKEGDGTLIKMNSLSQLKSSENLNHRISLTQIDNNMQSSGLIETDEEKKIEIIPR